jgi:hypothetical protein
LIVSLGNNISSDASGGLTNTGDQQNTDPQLAPLANYGGALPVQALCRDVDNPLADCGGASPAIDAGNNALAKTAGPDGIFGNGDDVPLTSDERGASFQRIVNGTVDIGAFEYYVNHAPTCLVGLGQITDDEQGLQSVPNWLINCSANDAGQQLQISILTDKGELFTQIPSVDESGTLTFDPAPNMHGLATITVVIEDSGGTASGGVNATIVPVQFSVAKKHRLFNASETGPRRGLDVTGSTSAAPDGFIVAQDVVAVINYINAHGSGKIPDNGTYGPPYVDVTGDDNVVAEDVLKIINYINAHPGQSEGEPEAQPMQPVAESSMDEILLLLAIDIAGQPRRSRRSIV